MTTSKRLAEKKVAKFEKNITRRGSVPETVRRDPITCRVDFAWLRCLCGVGSSLFLIIQSATSKGAA